MMRILRFQTRVNIVFALLLVMMLMGSVVLYKYNKLNRDMEHFLNHPFHVLVSTHQLQEKIANIDHWMNHYLKTENDSGIYEQIMFNDSLANKALNVVRINEIGDQSDIDTLVKDYHDYRKLIGSILALKDTNHNKAANNLFRDFEDTKRDRLMLQIDTISKKAQDKVDFLYDTSILETKKDIGIFAVVIGVLIMLILILGYFISKSITNPIQDFIAGAKALYSHSDASVNLVKSKISEEELLQQTLGKLKDSYQTLNNFNSELEYEVKKRTRSLKESRDKFQLLFEKSNDAFLIIKNGLFVDCNEAAVKMLGYAHKEAFLNVHPSKISPPIQPDGRNSEKKAKDLINKALETGSQRFEWIHIKSDGREIPIEVSLTTIVNKNHTKVIFCIWRDITHSKDAEALVLRAKERAEQSEEFLNNIVNKIVDPIFVKDDKSRILVVNDAFCEMFQMDEEEILGKTLAMDVSDEEMELFLQVDKEVLETGHDSVQEETITINDKETRNILTRKARFIDENGKKFLIGISTDITERKEFENELLTAKEKAEESERLKSAFLANMSHEIRTPMNAILGFSNLIKDQTLDRKKRDKFIDLINQAGNRLLNIISDIIDVSKINANQMAIHLEGHSLNKLIDDLFMQFSIQLKSDDLMLEVSKGLKDKDSHVETDSARLFQVLSNLIENALKFTDRGYVRFGYSIENNMVRFFVEDSGCGIPEKDRKLIFERFAQGSNNDSKTFKGNGLGLAIAKGIVELLGGSIWLDESLKTGTKFVFTVPYVKVQAKAITKTREKQLIMNSKMPQKTVLIAEDEVTNFIYLREVLKPFNFKILHAENGLEALEYFKENKHTIDLVLMDVKMPIMDGYEACSKIRKLDSTVPIVAITAYAFAEDEEKSIQAGCNYYLSKPVSKDLLFSTISNYVNTN